MRKVQIKLFGTFRKYVAEGSIELSIEDNCSARSLKKMIHDFLAENKPSYSEPCLVAESVLATESSILSDDSAPLVGSSFALLPPVCGG